MTSHRGGTLRLTAATAGGAIDPQVNDDPRFAPLFAVAYDGLLAVGKTGDGEALVPDLAEAPPHVSADGRTYAFILRPGVAFSDGSALKASDVASSFRRMLTVGAPRARSWFGGIVGAAACLEDAAGCTLAGGVIADDASRSVTIRLTEPDAAFARKLATPFAAILPAGGSGWQALNGPPPSSGPYMFAAGDAQGGLVMTRNPHFREWSADAQPDGFVDRIELAVGLPDEAETTAVLAGRFDGMLDDPPLDRLAELDRRKDLVHGHLLLAGYYLRFDASRPPFDDARARRAVAFAVDRAEAAKLYGGADVAAPLCQLLPVGAQGFRPHCPFTRKPGAAWTAPDLDAARRLIRESGASGQTVTLAIGDSLVDRSLGAYLLEMLKGLGFDARLDAAGGGARATLIGWRQDFGPADFLRGVLGCDVPGPAGAGHSCGKAIDADIKAARAAASDDWATGVVWSDIDQTLTEDAAATALLQPKRLDLVSSRVGNYAWSDQSGILLSRIWVR